MWRLTGREEYREWGWTVFSAFRRWCRARSGYTSLEARTPGGLRAVDSGSVFLALRRWCRARSGYTCLHGGAHGCAEGQGLKQSEVHVLIHVDDWSKPHALASCRQYRCNESLKAQLLS